MEYDQNTNEWFIPNLDDGVEKEGEDIGSGNALAMGFHDDEELFNPAVMGNDIKLSMMIDINNEPKNVYFSYDEKPKKKSTAVNTAKRPGTGKNFNY
jgi:hypothetical protein